MKYDPYFANHFSPTLGKNDFYNKFLFIYLGSKMFQSHKQTYIQTNRRNKKEDPFVDGAIRYMYAKKTFCYYSV